MTNKITVNTDTPNKVEVTATPGNIAITDSSSKKETISVAQGIVAGGAGTKLDQLGRLDPLVPPVLLEQPETQVLLEQLDSYNWITD